MTRDKHSGRRQTATFLRLLGMAALYRGAATGWRFLKNRARWWESGLRLLLVLAASCGLNAGASRAAVFNVRDYGASGQKADDARPGIQQAIEACAGAGGGVVRLPPGEYTSGTLRLRSRVRVEIEAGATLFASQDPGAYDYGQIPSKASLFYGENLEDVSLGGRGTVDGQAQYEWREDDFERAFDHKTLMQALGKPLRRSFPKDFPKRTVFPHLLWLGGSKNVRVSGLKFLHSPSWTIALYACQRAAFEDLYIYSSLKEAVWADGIDLDGCKDVSISRCVIETGDDCVVFISSEAWGPALPCEDITVSRCRLSSASAGVKFSEGNRAGVRRVRVQNTVLTNVNRGFVFATTLGGPIHDVTLSDLVIDCNRFDWFWAGDGQPFHFRVTRLSEFNREPPKPDEPPPGAIQKVVIRNVVARAKGSSLLHGHAENWLDGITLENVRLELAADPAAPFDRAQDALQFRWARNVKVKKLEVSWGQPALEAWRSALRVQDSSGLDLDKFTGRGAWPERDAPAVALDRVSNARIRSSHAPADTGIFLHVTGESSRDILLVGNDLRQARVPWQLSPEVPTTAVQTSKNSIHK